MKCVAAIFIFLFVFNYFSVSGQIITTVAGNGTYGYSGNGGYATDAQLAWEIGLVTDKAGNLYIADHDNNVIRKVDKAGIITDFAGTHILGYSGDGGLAVNAELYHPARMAIDAAGNLYFTDQNAEIIRKIDNAGIITTIAGLQPDGYSGDGGPLGDARFLDISGISFDKSGNMYIADYGNNVIRKVNTAGIITTLAGNGTPGFSGDNGPAVNAQLSSPYAVEVDNNGNIYIPDNGNHRIRKVNPSGIITTYVGKGSFGYSGDGGPAGNATLYYPWDIGMDKYDNLFICDYGNNVIRKVDASGIISTYAGKGSFGYSGDGGPAIEAELGEIADVVVDDGGNVYVSQRTPFYVVRKINNCLTASFTAQATDINICGGGSVYFGVAASNADAYQWQLNDGTGWVNVNENVIYTGSNTDTLHIANATGLLDSFLYRCIATNGCGNLFSAPAMLTVQVPLVPSITIGATDDTICNATPVTFSANAVNGGNAPFFQWKKNGINTGTNSANYTDIALADGDIITCSITSNASCITFNNALSNAVTITVQPSLNASVAITPSANNICFGSPVTFNALPVNGGISPAYQWEKNGIATGINNAVYTDNQLQDGDSINCVLASSQGCIANPAVKSNTIVIDVTPVVTPAIMISANATAVCKGGFAVFEAKATNGGNSPGYQWKINGIDAGTGSLIFTNNNILQGDAISCTLTSNATCRSADNANSNTIQMSIFPQPVVSLDHNNTLCTGSNRLLDAGPYAAYLWNDGSQSRTLSITNTGIYYVTVTDNNGCKATDTANITTIIKPATGFMPADTAICNYGSLVLKAGNGFSGYLWSDASINPTLTVSQPGDYWLEVTDSYNCKSRDTVKVAPKQCLNGLYIPTAFTPNGDGRNDLFRPLIYENISSYHLIIYNRWGQVIFETSDVNKGWDGTYKSVKQGSGSYVWVVKIKTLNGVAETHSGTVTIIL